MAPHVEMRAHRPRIVLAWVAMSFLRTLVAVAQRLAFRSPSVLGGAAGKLGLACDTCHPNGGINRDFFVPGLSDRPAHQQARTTLVAWSRTLQEVAALAEADDFGAARRAAAAAASLYDPRDLAGIR